MVLLCDSLNNLEANLEIVGLIINNEYLMKNYGDRGGCYLLRP